MPTNTAGNFGHQDYSQQVQYLRKRINYNSSNIATSFVIGYLPPGASVFAGGVHVVTAFNDSGTDTLDIGYIGGTTVAAAYASLLDVSAVGFIAADELASTTNIQGTVAHTVTCRYNGQNTNATAGVADVTIAYSLPIAN